MALARQPGSKYRKDPTSKGHRGWPGEPPCPQRPKLGFQITWGHPIKFQFPIHREESFRRRQDVLELRSHSLSPQQNEPDSLQLPC